MECFASFSFLASSEARVRLLRLVAERERVGRDTLRGQFDASRTTVQRNLDALVERGWPSDRHTEYAVTLLVASSRTPWTSSTSGSAPPTGLHALEATRDAIDGGATVELIVTTDVAGTLREDERLAPIVTALLDDGRFAVRVTDSEVPFHLGLLDDRIQVGVDEDGQPRALLESANDAVRNWAERRYEEWKVDARPFER